MKDIKLIIFDVGGVLRDSSELINEGFRIGFKKQGLPYYFKSKDVWHLRGIGKYNNSENAIKACLALLMSKKNLKDIITNTKAEMTIDKIVREKIFISDSDLVSKINKEYKIFFNSKSSGKIVRLNPRIRHAIELLKKKFKLAIFTDSSDYSVRRDLSTIGLDNFLEIIGEDDIRNKKPSGEGILLVCRKLKISPNNAVYVGDSAVDIMAAKDAGCISVALKCGMGMENILKKEKPDYIFRDLYEMAKHFIIQEVHK